MAAALIDGGLSEDSESDSDTPNPSPMQSFIEEGFISPDSTVAGKSQQETAEEIEEAHWSTTDREWKQSGSEGSSSEYLSMEEDEDTEDLQSKYGRQLLHLPGAG